MAEALVLLFGPFSVMLAIAWRLWVAGLVPPLVLGFPLLLAAWALFRLRGAAPAGGLGRAYLLANYGTAVQLSNLQGEQVLVFLAHLIFCQVVATYTALQALILWRSVPPGLMVGGVFLAAWVAYRFARPTVKQRFRAWDTAAVYAAYPPRQRRAWGLLGHALFWGAFTSIFIIAILREYVI